MAYIQVEEIIREGLHEFLDDLQDRLNASGQAIFDTFFALRPIEGALSMKKGSSEE
jgi:uncharacterized alpha-E superfamily protein